MHKQRLMEHMAEALSAHGFTCTPGAALEGRSGSLYNVPLLAESDQLAVLFDATEENPLTAQTIAALANIASDVGAERGVLCHTASVDNAAKTACAGIVALWDAKTMANLVGHAQLAGITGTTPPAPSFDCPAVEAPEIHSLDELLPPAFSEPEVGTSMDLDALETLDWEPSQPAAQEPDLFAGFAEETFSLDEPATELASFEQPIEAVPEEPTIPRLPVHVSPDEARRAAQERLFAVDSVELVLQPVHLLDYECELLTEGSLKFDNVQGRLQVHGTNKEVTEVDPDEVDASVPSRMVQLPDLPTDERTLRVRDETAETHALGHIMAAHTRNVEVKIQDVEADVEMVERRDVAPRQDNIDLRSLGVHHRVLWRLRGPNGSVHVDALTGVFVEESLRSPDPGTVTLD